MKLLFIHHSTGGNLLREGNVRSLLYQKNPLIELWDHNYNLYRYFPRLLARFTNHKGLSDNNGKITGKDFNIVLSNNSPKEYAEIFSRDKKNSTLKAILQYDLIVFKNCYPTTKIESDDQLELYKKYYEQISHSLLNYKQKFVLMTPPPLREELTTIANATRAKKLAKCLTSAQFLNENKKFYVFNFFNLLADEKGFLKKKYTKLISIDSHPNDLANREIAPEFVNFLIVNC